MDRIKGFEERIVYIDGDSVACSGENMDHPNYRADYTKDVAYNAEKIKGGLNESVDSIARFKKLANIK